jgi:predicted metal-dependent enzyme (double-stranded beta helix superfamily)
MSAPSYLTRSLVKHHRSYRNVKRGTVVNSTMIRPASTSSAGRLLGARQLADVVQRYAECPGEWLQRVRLNPAGRWYEQVTLDESHEVWLISWLPGQETGFHNHGGAAGAFTVVLGSLTESRVVGANAAGQVLSKPVKAGATRSFGPRYIHNVQNTARSSLAVSVHAYSPPLTAMTRYELTQNGLVTLGTEASEAWSAA